MMEEVYDGTYMITLPLPKNPLRSVNCYLIRGADRDLLVDTGMNRPECRAPLDEALKELGVFRPEVFVTHMHADHLGLAPHISGGEEAVYLGDEDRKVISESTYWSGMLEYALRCGFPRVDPHEAIRKHPGYRFGPLGEMRISSLFGGERLDLGERQLEAVWTPGHSRGHMCLYEREERTLFSGDHILFDITPNISLWSDEEDPLSRYLGSLKMVSGMKIERTLPGHRSRMGDPTERIDELTRHHHERAEEVLSILEGGPLDPFTTASRMKWDMTYDSFDDLPIMQKWFALGEAIAHLKFLETTGRAERLKGERVRYRNI